MPFATSLTTSGVVENSNAGGKLLVRHTLILNRICNQLAHTPFFQFLLSFYSLYVLKIQLYFSLDEETCVIAPDIQIKLSGSSKPGQGYIELKAYNYSFGGICDDGFGIEEAHVICRYVVWHIYRRETANGENFPAKKLTGKSSYNVILT